MRQLSFRAAAQVVMGVTLCLLPQLATGQTAGDTLQPRSDTAARELRSLSVSVPEVGEPLARGEASLSLLRSVPRLPGTTGRLLVESRGTVLTLGLATVGLMSIDKSITQAWSEEIVPRTRAVPDLYGPHRMLGGVNGWLVTGLGASWVAGVAFHQPRLEQAAVKTTGSMALAWGLAHVVMKPVFGRTRPVSNWSSTARPVAYRTRDPWEFRPFRPVRFGPWEGESALPSAHAAIYASVAEALHDVGVPRWISWTGAGAAYLSLAPKHNHWVSDMFLGGTVGVLAAAAVDRAMTPRDKAGAAKGTSSRYTVAPILAPGQVGLGGTFTFGGF